MVWVGISPKNLKVDPNINNFVEKLSIHVTITMIFSQIKNFDPKETFVQNICFRPYGQLRFLVKITFVEIGIKLTQIVKNFEKQNVPINTQKFVKKRGH